MTRGSYGGISVDAIGRLLQCHPALALDGTATSGDSSGMERFKPYMRWAAVAVAAIALVFAYVSPHRVESVGLLDDSPPPAQQLESPAPLAAAPSSSSPVTTA